MPIWPGMTSHRSRFLTGKQRPVAPVAAVFHSLAFWLYLHKNTWVRFLFAQRCASTSGKTKYVIVAMFCPVKCVTVGLSENGL